MRYESQQSQQGFLAPWSIDEDGRLLNASRSFGESKFAREMLDSSHCIKIKIHSLNFSQQAKTKQTKCLPEGTVYMQASQTSNPSCLERRRTRQGSQVPKKNFVLDNKHKNARVGITVDKISNQYRE